MIDQRQLTMIARAEYNQDLAMEWSFDARMYYRNGQWGLASHAQSEAEFYYRKARNAYAQSQGYDWRDFE